MRILVVDDESWSRDIVGKILSNEGHTVDLAANGQEGLTKLYAGKYDLVITDLAMPDLSGEEIAGLVKQNWPDLPVILLTGFGDILMQEREKPSGVDLILSKPVTIAGLVNSVALFQGRW